MILNKDEFILNKEKYLKLIREGAIFLYPTDTIYGIGCDATNDKSVKKIRDMKERPKNPFSVMAPSKKWILENCKIHDIQLNKLPGAYTFIVKLKKDCVSGFVNNDMQTLGIRIPDHWFSEIAKELKLPIVTTSVNKAGKEFMTSLDNLDKDIKNKVDFIIYEGGKKGKPSTIVDFTEEDIKIKER
jgi:tRNA threonylcarbamoyl adenosine modification protein (Sua5/YciO/YrdC/YwlC family)